MDGRLLDFCKRYKRKLADDADMKRYSESFAERVSSYITRERPATNVFTVHHLRVDRAFTSDPREIFTLDNEDLQYLYNKYSKKLGEELDHEKEKLDRIYHTAIIEHS